jgi:hypothetical protein
VIWDFIGRDDSLLFEILLYPGDFATVIQDYCEYEHEYEDQNQDESDILIAESPGSRLTTWNGSIFTVCRSCYARIEQV